MKLFLVKKLYIILIFLLIVIKTIIFDLGGVVLSRGFWIFREYLVKKYGVTIEQTLEVFIKKYYNLYFSGKISENEFWNKSLEELNINVGWKSLKNKLLNFYTLNEEMFRLIDSLRKKGYKVILLSDQTKEWWSRLNKKYSIDSHFDYYILSYEIGVNKPNPEIYKLALVKSGSKAKNSLFIDDLEQNLVPANKLGIRTILFRDCESLKKELISLGVKLD